MLVKQYKHLYSNFNKMATAAFILVSHPVFIVNTTIWDSASFLS